MKIFNNTLPGAERLEIKTVNQQYGYDFCDNAPASICPRMHARMRADETSSSLAFLIKEEGFCLCVIPAQ